jgi:hypothetical protein
MIFEPFVGELANRLAESIAMARAVPQGGVGPSLGLESHHVLKGSVPLSIAEDS